MHFLYDRLHMRLITARAHFAHGFVKEFSAGICTVKSSEACMYFSFDNAMIMSLPFWRGPGWGSRLKTIAWGKRDLLHEWKKENNTCGTILSHKSLCVSTFAGVFLLTRRSKSVAQAVRICTAFELQKDIVLARKKTPNQITISRSMHPLAFVSMRDGNSGT